MATKKPSGAVAAKKKRRPPPSPPAKSRSPKTPSRPTPAVPPSILKADEEEKRREHYRSIPQKHWIEMSGRAAKVLYEQAERYEIPFGDRIIDLYKVARALHDFLAKNKYRFIPDEADPLLAGSDSPALERYRLAKAKLCEMDLLERSGAIIKVDELEIIVFPALQAMRETGRRLAAKFGNEAGDEYAEGLADLESAIRRAIDKLAGRSESGSEPGPELPARLAGTDAEPKAPQPQ